MTQALYTSKTGMMAGQTQIDVIANNVANINTTAYKAANVTFSTLFSNTLSNGSAATNRGGGTNPKQIGLGTQVSSISRDFGIGTYQQTGLSSDLMISGNGYFVVQDSSGAQFLTRDGHFSLDSDGNLVTASGCKVVGTSEDYSNKSSSVTVKVPSNLGIEVFGTAQAELANKIVSDLNGVSLSEGEVIINIGSNTHELDSGDFAQTAPGDDSEYEYNGGAVTYTKLDTGHLTTNDYNALRSIYGEVDPTEIYYKGDDGTYIRGAIPANGIVVAKNVQRTLNMDITEADLNGTLQDLVTSLNTQLLAQTTAMFPGEPDKTVEFSIVDGKLQLTNDTGENLSFANGQTSNFLEETGLDVAFEDAVAGQTAFITDYINKSAEITTSTSFDTAVKRTDWSVSERGVISATYEDGSILTVSLNENGRLEWQLTTQDNTVIKGSGAETSDLDMSRTDLDPASMILEMATVINDGGLIAEADNMWSIGPNAGDAYYGMSGVNGFANLKSGGLEGSNVDMTTDEYF